MTLRPHFRSITTRCTPLLLEETGISCAALQLCVQTRLAPLPLRERAANLAPSTAPARVRDNHLPDQSKGSLTHGTAHPSFPRRHQEAAALSIVIADSHSPRDGRFIEKIGFYNPLLPRDHADRLKLDLDKAKAWIAKGAVASDRVHRCSPMRAS